MQRGPSARGGVRIGAAIEEERRELEVRVARRQQERVEAGLLLSLSDPAGRLAANSPTTTRRASAPPSRSVASRVDPAFARGKQQRREAAARASP